jgi:hypothetical protein
MHALMQHKSHPAQTAKVTTERRAAFCDGMSGAGVDWTDIV